MLQKANRLQKYWILLRSLWATFLISLKVLCYRQSRKNTDKLGRTWSQKLLDIVHLKVKVFDPYHLTFQSNRHYVLMSNHAGNYDIPVIVVSVPAGIRMLVKREFRKVPIWGRAILKGEHIFVDRYRPHQAIKDLEIARKKIESGLVLSVFPEGTRSRTGKLGKFKKGGFVLAQQTHAIIVPIGLRGTEKIMPPDTLDFYLNQQVEVHIGQPVDTADFTDRTQLMQTVRQRILEAAALSE